MPGVGKVSSCINPITPMYLSRGDADRAQKIVDPCPYCKSRRPKDLVEGPRRFHVGPYLLFSFITCGLGLLLFPIFFQRQSEAYCRNCDITFPLRR